MKRPLKIAYKIVLILFPAFVFSLQTDDIQHTPHLQEYQLDKHEDKSKEDFRKNPGITLIHVGSGALGKRLGYTEESGVRFGFFAVEDYNYLFCGGVKPRRGAGDSWLEFGLELDTEKLGWWDDGMFILNFSQFNCGKINIYAGDVQGGFNDLPGIFPLDRSELFECYYRHALFDEKLVFRIGKMITNNDFADVLKPLEFVDETLSIPRTTNLTYTPIYTIPSLLGVIPGLYNSAWGISATFAPTKNYYASCGVFDGNLARGKNTGIRIGPQINQYKFSIAETGVAWILGKKKLPGHLAFGSWYQSGKLSTRSGVSQRGTSGFYLFGTQRLWRRHPGVDNSGIIGFVQSGITFSKTLPIKRTLCSGLTFFGLIPYRKDDWFGFGFTWSKLNRNVLSRSHELMVQGFYRMYLTDVFHWVNSFTYIPNPGAEKHLKPAYGMTSRLLVFY